MLNYVEKVSFLVKLNAEGMKYGCFWKRARKARQSASRPLLIRARLGLVVEHATFDTGLNFCPPRLAKTRGFQL